jgi:hypothetical protein
LANFDSRSLQLLWAILHFVFVGAFIVNLILLVGSAAYIKECGGLFKHVKGQGEGSEISYQAFLYGLAGIIVVYTAVISCLIDVGDSRHRVPTDVFIVFMFFVGTDLWRRLLNGSKAVLRHPQ